MHLFKIERRWEGGSVWWFLSGIFFCVCKKMRCTLVIIADHIYTNNFFEKKIHMHRWKSAKMPDYCAPKCPVSCSNVIPCNFKFLKKWSITFLPPSSSKVNIVRVTKAPEVKVNFFVCTCLTIFKNIFWYIFFNLEKTNSKLVNIKKYSEKEKNVQLG